jgi:hypothetical protein
MINLDTVYYIRNAIFVYGTAKMFNQYSPKVGPSSSVKFSHVLRSNTHG